MFILMEVKSQFFKKWHLSRDYWFCVILHIGLLQFFDQSVICMIIRVVVLLQAYVMHESYSLRCKTKFSGYSRVKTLLKYLCHDAFGKQILNVKRFV